ncbi:MAG: hypothetical protein P1U39_08875 [Legionellaceae bacterium]|nr:hypothetical protein [Legionellaceae bacterium]
MMNTSSRAVTLSQQYNQRRCMLSLYGLLDGIDIASKTLVLFAPLFSTHSLRVWALTHEGFYLSLLFVGSISILSTLGNAFNGSKNTMEKTVFRVWQIMRDVIKGAKIAYKAIKNMLALMRIWPIHQAKPILLTLTLPLILLFIMNRLVTRSLGNQRKDAQTSNKALLKKLESLWQAYCLAPEGATQQIAKQHYLAFVRDAKLHQLETQSQLAQCTLFVSSLIEAVINGCYMFMGAAVLTPASPQAMLFITCVSITMILMNIISAWHEEFEHQLKLQRTEQALHVACAVHELELALLDLRTTAPTHTFTTHAPQRVQQKQREFEQEKNKHNALYKSTYVEALLIGLRYAVATHKAIMGALGCMALVSGLMLGTTLTEAVVLACVSLSIIASLALCVYAFEETRLHIIQQDQAIQHQQTAITTQINTMIINTHTPSLHEHSMFTQHTKALPLAKRTLLKEAETIRACFSGSKKPKHLCEFALLFQTKPDHPMQTSTGATCLQLFGMVCYCLLWWLKAHDKQYPQTSSIQEHHAMQGSVM